MNDKTQIRECEKPDDGLIKTFLGFPQKKNNRERDELRRSPYLLLSPRVYDSLAARIFMTVLRLLQAGSSILVTLLFIGSMAYGVIFTISTVFGWVKQLLGI